MELLIELLTIITEAKKSGSKSARQKVYHADYIKTKNKSYRQYKRSKHKKSKS